MQIWASFNKRLKKKNNYSINYFLISNYYFRIIFIRLVIEEFLISHWKKYCLLF